LPGHVSAITGSRPYAFLARDFGLAAVISGFEPVDILQSIVLLARQIKSSAPKVEIQYRRGVQEEGNPRAREILNNVFEPVDAEWRGLGVIPESGLALRPEFHTYDPLRIFAPEVPEPVDPPGCRCGEVLRGVLRPAECPLFDRVCNTENPVGPCMVSSEGSCAAAYKYER